MTGETKRTTAKVRRCDGRWFEWQRGGLGWWWVEQNGAPYGPQWPLRADSARAWPQAADAIASELEAHAARLEPSSAERYRRRAEYVRGSV